MRDPLHRPPHLPHRHGWLRHIIKGLESDPHLQYKVHLWAVRIWVVNMLAATTVFVLAQGIWAKVSVLYLVLISLYANLATDYGSMSASMAAFTPGEQLPVIPLEGPQVTAHYALTQQVHDLAAQIAGQVALLDEIHQHVTGDGTP